MAERKKPLPPPQLTGKGTRPRRVPISDANAGILEGAADLSALRAEFQSTGAPTAPTDARRTLPVTDLVPLPGQPRRMFPEGPLQALIDSVREQGVLTPLLVRELPHPPHQIIAGERRWRAAQAAGLSELPVVMMQLDERAALEVALVDNLQRADLSVVDRTEATAQLIALALDIPAEQLTARLHALRKKPGDPGHPEQIAVLDTLFRRLGGNWKSYLSNHAPILRWPPDVLEAVRNGLEYSKGAVLARIEDPKRRAALLKTAPGMSLDALRAEVAAGQAPPAATRATRVKRVQHALRHWKQVERLPAAQQERFEELLDELAGLLQTD